MSVAGSSLLQQPLTTRSRGCEQMAGTHSQLSGGGRDYSVIFVCKYVSSVIARPESVS